MVRMAWSVALFLLVCVGVAGVANGGLVLHLPLDSNISDATGNYTGITVGGEVAVTTTDSAVGVGSAIFDGTADYIDVVDSFPLGTGSFTWCMWVNLEEKRGATSAFRHQLVQNGAGTTSTQLFVSRYGTVGFYSSVGFSDTFTNVTVDDSEWHHVAAVVDRSVAGEFKLTYYIDGQFDSSETKSISATTSLTPSGSVDDSLYLGNCSYNASRTTDGLLDDIRFYDEALSASDIGSIANVPEPSTVILLLGIALAGLAIRKR